MPQRLKAVAFDLDANSLISLREALPEWDIDLVAKATTGSLALDRSPGTADLVILAAGGRTADTLGLCRILRSQVGRAQVPLLVLVPPDRNALVEAVLEAGADSCLLLPVHAKEIVSMLNHLREGNRPGRHTLNLEQAQYKDRWRDEGGQG